MSQETAETPAWTDAVLQFWFSELGEPGWWAKNETIDRQIHERFGSVREELARGDVRVTAGQALLSAVIVLDHFSRNLFRGSPRAYDADPLARELARQAIERGLDLAMQPEERMFLYLPFEHSEEREDQALAVDLISQLGNDEWTRFAKAHKALIERFGRFPHRNAILGRDSTADELEALKDPMNSF